MTDDTAHPTLTPPPSMGDEELRTFFDQSNAARQVIADSAMAAELDTLGDYLLARAESMQAVSTMSEPVRADAVAIARDILRKLKISFGAATILDGLGLRNAEDGVLFGSIKDVVQIYEHMVAWACGVDASILGDPSIQAAIAAIGKIGYLAKRESLRLARQANLALLANRVAQQLAALDAQFAHANDPLDTLLDTIERGMNRVINRVTSVSVSGAAVSHAQDGLGSFMSAAPTAGVARTLGADVNSNRDAVGKRNAEALLAEEAAHQAEAARIQAQNAARAKRNEKTAPAPARPAAATGRQAVQQARAAQRRQQAASATPNPAQSPAGALTSARLNSIHHIEEAAHEHHDHELQVQRQFELQMRQNAQKMAAQRNAVQRMSKPTAIVAPASPKPLASGDLSHAMESTHHVETAHHAPEIIHHAEPIHPTEMAHGATKSAVPPIDAHLLKGLDLKGFDMSGVKGEPVATSHAELRKQLTAAALDPDKILPPLPPTQNKGLVR